MLRVIAGTVRGRKLHGPPERRAPHAPVARRGRLAAPPPSRTVLLAQTRPTSDLIRGVIFDMLDAMGADYARVMDLYAGTGALGIEALSRGEGTADFVEADAATVGVIKENLRACGFESRAAVHSLTTERAVARLTDSGPYTLILADPPYYDEGAPAAVAAAAASALVGDGTVFVFEHHRRLAPPEALGPLALYKSRRHGDTVVSIYGGEEQDS